MAADSERWDARYRSRENPDTPVACAVLQDNLHLLPARGRALDLACGRGGNALLLARHGLETHAWDFSAEAIEILSRHVQGLGLRIIAELRDVSEQPPPANRFDVIAVSHFLDRPVCGAIAAALRPGGLLYYQTFTTERVTDNGPSNPDYRLAPNELLRLFPGLRVVFYREEGRLGNTGQGFRDRAQFIGLRSE